MNTYFEVQLWQSKNKFVVPFCITDLYTKRNISHSSFFVCFGVGFWFWVFFKEKLFYLSFHYYNIYKLVVCKVRYIELLLYEGFFVYAFL